MQAFTKITAKVIPLPLKDVDTDMIIPAQYLTSISKEGYGENLFIRLKQEQPDFPFNQDKFADAQILVAKSNFGCGSSREHAAWAILGAGIRVVIAPGFADIFFNNSAKNGLVLVELDAEVINGMLVDAENGNYEITVDLEAQTVILPDNTSYKFNFDPFRKECILNGYEELDFLLAKSDEIGQFKEERDKNLFFSTK
ncbi:3-isopropylmalate dehydratase small subunit [Patescibacteria group bacterium]|nr:3-isopropylmalate dehydratase small subunit [Patescibacteria group bacterium]